MAGFNKKKYYPQHMHIHSIYEPGASMAGHMYFASLIGMKHIWFTEHDVYWNKKPFSFGFEQEELELDENCVPTRGFLPTQDSFDAVTIDREHSYEGTASFRITAKANSSDRWQGVSAAFSERGICQSFCRLPIMSIAHRAVKHTEGDVRIIIDICLSERPPDQHFAHILFVSGSTDGLSRPHTLILPLSVGEEWKLSEFDLAEIAQSDAAKLIGGLDNVISYLTVSIETRNGASASLYLDSLKITGRATAEETKLRQNALAAEIGKEYGVTPFVTAEISAGGHKNCYTTDTPIFKYGDPEKKVTHEEACQEMIGRGLVFSINHPFVNLKGDKSGNVDYDAACDAMIEKLAADNAGGATLLEVGFPFGRYAPYETHMRLWDGLACRGVILTGYGATDSHMMTEGWFSGNNFASFIGVDAECEPREADFAAGMRAGSLYAANPLVIKGEVSFTADEKRDMGSVNVVPLGTKSRVKLSLEISNHNWKVAWIVNGERVRLDATTRMGYNGEFELTTSKKIDFVRAEVYDYFGTLLCMTNPIYFTSELKNIKNNIDGRAVNR